MVLSLSSASEAVWFCTASRSCDRSPLALQPQRCPLRVAQLQRRRGSTAIIDEIFIASVVVTTIAEDLHVEYEVGIGRA
jgi:hypothetical protein